MKRLITALFSSTAHADMAVKALKGEGFSEDDMSVISKSNETGNNMYIGASYAAAINDDVINGITAGNMITGMSGIVMGLGMDDRSDTSIVSAFFPPEYENVRKIMMDLGLPSDIGKSLEKEVKNNKTLFYMETNENDIDTVMTYLRANGAERIEIH